MPSEAQPDEYESDDFEETETMISRNKSRPKSSFELSSKRGSRKGRKRPVTPAGRRSQSALGFRTGKDLWMTAIKKRQTFMHSNSRHAESPRHKTPLEFWVETLRKTGQGRSTESSRLNTMTGLQNGNEKFYPYLSTSHYMRAAMGTEKPGKYEDPTVKPSPGRPAYKTPEEYYDEVLELRKLIAALSQESATHKTKIRRLEEDNQKKEKEIQSLLNPGQSEEIRRTLGDRKPDSGAVIHSLKQKILKLEVQLRDRESAYSKLKADLKVTKIEELKAQMEVLYQEIVRLQNVKTAAGSKSSSDNPIKIKAMNETLLRLSRTNEQLSQENKSLKDDLEKALNEAVVKPDLERDHEDKNRRDLLLTIASLERKLEKVEHLETDSSVSSTGRDLSHSKLVLKGTTEQRLSQLDQHETELLDEISRLKQTIRRLREDRGKRAERDERDALPPTPTPRRRAVQDVGSVDSGGSRPSSARRPSSAHRPSSAQRPSGSQRPSSSPRPSSGQRPSSGHRPPSSGRESVMSEDTAARVDQFRQSRAAKSIQRQWRNHKHQHDQEMEKRIAHFSEERAARKIQQSWRQHKKEKHEIEERVLLFKENRAAKKIQNEWLGYRHRKHEADVDDAAYVIQAAFNGHQARRKQKKKLADDTSSTLTEDDSDNDDVFLIQSCMRGQQSRLEQMRRLRNQRYDSYEDEDEYYDTKSPGDSRRSSTSLQRPSSALGPRRKPSPAVHVFKPKYDTGLLGDEDDDDDIVT